VAFPGAATTPRASACVPAGRDAVIGLPVGALLTGRRMGDEESFDAAEAIEQRLQQGVDTTSAR